MFGRPFSAHWAESHESFQSAKIPSQNTLQRALNLSPQIAYAIMMIGSWIYRPLYYPALRPRGREEMSFWKSLKQL